MLTLGIFILVLLGGSTWAVVRLGGWRGALAGAAVVVAGVLGGATLYSLRPQPPAQPCTLPSHRGDLGSVCGFHNPEDVEALISQDLLLVTEEGLGGRVLALRPNALQQGPRVLWPRAHQTREASPNAQKACRPNPDHSKVGTQGLSVLEAPSSPPRVAIITHELRSGLVTDAIQIFEFNEGSFTWIDCIPFPDDAIGNDIAWLSDGSILATKFAPRGTSAQLSASVLRGAVGRDTGDVMRWSPSKGWTHLPGTEGAIPNGIAVARDEKSFFFADAGRHRISIVSLERPDAPIVRVPVGGAPDNLSVTPSGTVLTAVATLSGDLPVLCGLGGRTCRSGWAVWEIDPQTRRAAALVADDGRRIATGTSALASGDRIFIGSMADDRLGVFQRR